MESTILDLKLNNIPSHWSNISGTKCIAEKYQMGKYWKQIVNTLAAQKSKYENVTRQIYINNR